MLRGGGGDEAARGSAGPIRWTEEYTYILRTEWGHKRVSRMHFGEGRKDIQTENRVRPQTFSTMFFGVSTKWPTS